MKEIEAKIPLPDKNLLPIKELSLVKKVTVYDEYYDTKDETFYQEDKALRLREENKEVFIAYKGPRETHEHLVVREEIETTIGSLEKAQQFLQRLGYEVKANAEKIRTYYTHKDYPTLSITLDEYPFIGAFTEIEGEEHEVYAFTKQYGLDITNASQRTCTGLFKDYCKQHKLPFKNYLLHFTFADEEKLN